MNANKGYQGQIFKLNLCQELKVTDLTAKGEIILTTGPYKKSENTY